MPEGVASRGLKFPVKDAAVQVHMLIQGRTEAVAEGRCPAACRGAATGTVCAPTAFHHAQQDPQDGALHGRITVQEIAQALGYRQHPLAHRPRR